MLQRFLLKLRFIFNRSSSHLKFAIQEVRFRWNIMDSNHAGVPALILQAAQSAALADGVASAEAPSSMNMLQQQQQQQQLMMQTQQQQSSGPTPGIGQPPKKTGGKKKGPPLRRGKWTSEEEAYAGRLIQEFKAGLLPLTDGTTLRTFLSKLLNCDPMRISKKFVGSNCIGKQVFRRRTADLNRLTPEQIQKSRTELSDLERRFLERVAQTNRVKSSGVVGGGGTVPPNSGSDVEVIKRELDAFVGDQQFTPFQGGNNLNNLGTANNQYPPSPPWLQPPLGYRQGAGASMAASGGNSRAAAAGRALLGGFRSSNSQGSGSGGLGSQDSSAGLLAALQQRASQQSMSNLFASQGSSMAQLAQSASAARMGGLGNNNSIGNMLQGLSRDQLNQFARDRGISSASLSGMLERKSSFDALMNLDFQSLQSIDNLANLAHSNSTSQKNIPSSGLQNWSLRSSGMDGNAPNASSASLSNVARRLAAVGNMESLLRNMSTNNMNNNNSSNAFSGNNGSTSNGGISHANLQSLLQNMQNGSSMSSLFANSSNNNNGMMGGSSGTQNNNAQSSVASLANLLRDSSSTGLSALRMQDGFSSQRNSSVEDFLNLVADGYLPHPEPSLLSVPLMQHQQQLQQHQQQQSGSNGNDSEALLAQHQQQQQQLFAQAAAAAAATGNSQLANALSSRSFGSLAGTDPATAALLAQLGSAGAGTGADQSISSSSSSQQQQQAMLKRRFVEMGGDLSSQGTNKR